MELIYIYKFFFLASAPLPANYNRSTHPELYAGAYEMHRQNQHKV